MATKTHQQTPIFFNKSVSRYVSFSVYSNETKKDARVPLEHLLLFQKRLSVLC